MPAAKTPFSIVPPPQAPTGSQFPFYPMWPSDIQAGIRPEFDPRGTGYDYATALAHGVRRDPTPGGHLYSRDPQTGQALKGAGHETFWKGLEGDRQAGYTPFAGPDDRIYSTPTPREPLQRMPHPKELEFFHQNRSVAGYASSDGKIVMNPFANLAPEERHAVMQNELYRLLTRDQVLPRFAGELTSEQAKTLAANPFYSKATPEEQVDTVMGRLLSGDPSAGAPSPEQQKYLDEIGPKFKPFLVHIQPMTSEQ